jgi:hypothetical protein
MPSNGGEPLRQWGTPLLEGETTSGKAKRPSSPGSPTRWHQQPGPRTPTGRRGHVIRCPNPRLSVRGCRSAWVWRRHHPGLRTPCRGLGQVIPCPRPRRGVRGATVVSEAPSAAGRRRPATPHRPALPTNPGRLTRPRGIRVAASFPGRDGGCQGSRSRRDAEGALDTRRLDLDNHAAETATPGEPCRGTPEAGSPQRKLKPRRRGGAFGWVGRAPT